MEVVRVHKCPFALGERDVSDAVLDVALSYNWSRMVPTNESRGLSFNFPLRSLRLCIDARGLTTATLTQLELHHRSLSSCLVGNAVPISGLAGINPLQLLSTLPLPPHAQQTHPARWGSPGGHPVMDAGSATEIGVRPMPRAASSCSCAAICAL